MRMWFVLFVATLMLAGCGAGSSPQPNQVTSQTAAILDGVTIPLTTADIWKYMQQTLQSPVDVYSAAWSRALRGKGAFEDSVGVAALAEGDISSAFCSPAPSFDVAGKTLVYCGAAHAGQDPLPQSAFILVPYGFYIATLPNMNIAEGQATGRLGTALLLARVYALHVVGQLKRLGLKGLQADCVAGLTLRSFIPTMIGQAWLQAVTFAGKFSIDGLPSPNELALMTGYWSGRLQACS